MGEQRRLSVTPLVAGRIGVGRSGSALFAAKGSEEPRERLLLAMAGMAKPIRDLLARSLRFSTELVTFIEFEQHRRVIPARILDQLLRAGTSVGAHNAEAESALTRRHLLALRGRALQEAQEAQYWLKVIAGRANAHSPDAVHHLLAQLSQLVAILTTCVRKLKGE